MDSSDGSDSPKQHSQHSQASNVVSIIPDVLPYNVADNKLPWIPGVGTSFSVKYTLHNPEGPKWYKNHHLIPPQNAGATSQFSASFPPIAHPNDSLQPTSDANRMPGPSRTPSGSPLPTPASSQTRVGEGMVPFRTRKLSQTAHDNVDMMDGTDPWGTNWHHQSPYDVGLSAQISQSNLVLAPHGHEVRDPSCIFLYPFVCH